MNEAMEAQAKKLLQIAQELESAAAHARTAANHFKSGEIPRACAHSFAVDGHIIMASDLLQEIAKEHRLRAMSEQ